MKTRTPEKILEMKDCFHFDWFEKEIEREYGFKDCCICSQCGVSCGEKMNAEYIDDEEEEEYEEYEE